MVIIFACFGYDKWFESEITALAPIISARPLISWTIPVLGIKGTAILLGTAEWTFGTLLLLGFWNKKLGMLGAIGSIHRKQGRCPPSAPMRQIEGSV